MEPLRHSQLEQYFFEHFEALHRYAYTILKDNDDAKDVVQHVFIQLWEKRDTLTIRESVRSYLYVAVHNQSLNKIKSQKIRQKHYDNFSAGESETTIYQQESAAAAELKKEVLAAMDTLPEKCREVFYKSRFEEKTYQEIATELDISIKTVEAQMGKALRILRTILADKTFCWLIVMIEINKLVL